ncbi:MAG: MBOAT family O-acyltransferase [Thermodesulfobacteriota bacterium]
MLFNSMRFLFFFIIVMGMYFAIPYRFRWILLLGASYYFYISWKPAYVILIIITTLITYYAGLRMAKIATKSKRKTVLILSLFFNLGCLFVFKYYNFFNDSLRVVLQHYNLFYGNPALNVLLPIGISFYTFKNLSYAIDVYRGDQPPEKHLGYYALYVAFFPQLLAGPIERAKRFLPQLIGKCDFDYWRVTNGLKLMLWGLFQKMVIADNLAPLVDAVYNDPTHHSGVGLVLATLFFAFQIYCDFAGYSDIAIGAAQVMGFTTMDNFNRPYFSKSIPEFWRRWHISLSTWFRDYLYISMGGNRVSIPRWYINLFVVLLICGLWHGANWTFIVWGGLHGLYLVFSAFTRDIREKIHKAMGLDRVPRLHNYFKVTVTFSLVCFAWIFFRANSISDALYIISHLFIGWGGLVVRTLKAAPFFGPLKFHLVVGVVSVGVLLLIHLSQEDNHFDQWLSEKRIGLRWAVYYSMVVAILLFGNFGTKEFIYFQF